MILRTDNFCALANAPAWLAWLFDFSRELYGELHVHLMGAHGCSANRDKMLQILEKIKAVEGGEQRLWEFLRREVPATIEDDSDMREAAAPPAGQPLEPLNVHGVFDHYDPNLFTIPKRMILANADRNALRAEVERFIAGRPAEYVLVGNQAYIEYLPAEYAELIDQIPPDSWQVLAYKSKIQ